MQLYNYIYDKYIRTKKVFCFGLDNSGKTELLKRLLYENALLIDTYPDNNYYLKCYLQEGVQYIKYQFNHSIRFPYIYQFHCDDDCILYVVDSSDLENISENAKGYEYLTSITKFKPRHLFIVLTKRDKGGLSINEIKEAFQYDSKCSYVEFFEVNALTGEGVNELRKRIKSIF